MKIFLILPTQLFEDVKHLNIYDKIYLIKDEYYLNQTFHKQKLILHDLSIEYYFQHLKSKKIKCIIVDKILNNSKDEYTMYHPTDKEMILKYNYCNFLDTPMFINTLENLNEYKSKYSSNSQSTFYKYMRDKLNILNTDKLSYDNLNRKQFPKEYQEDKIQSYNTKINIAKYISGFGNAETFYYGVTHKEAKKILTIFIKNKLEYFGPYQDAIKSDVIFGYHSNISHLLNIGLLTPKYVIKKVIEYHNKNKLNISSVEGFIRQIIGWREYMRMIYLYYTTSQINPNIFSNKLPNTWYTGKTKIKFLDNTIQKVYNTGYLHHIERLMIMNNIATLSEIKFTDIYKWFMICFIDSYVWVMIPNVLMNYNSLNYDNIRYMNRVYISSFNYIKKMSDYKDKNDEEIIKNMYKNFLKKNKNILKKDYIISKLLKNI
jgi:deoxyribodipyrimidine photolyase-related protein